MEAPKTYKEQQEVTWTARSEGWAITHAELINERTRLLTRLSQESNTTEIYRTQGRLAAIAELLTWVDNRVQMVEKGD